MAAMPLQVNPVFQCAQAPLVLIVFVLIVFIAHKLIAKRRRVRQATADASLEGLPEARPFLW